MKLQAMVDASRAKHRQDHQDKEKLKRGVLRAGSTGIMNEEGEIGGACHRVSLLRSQGIEIDPPTWDKYIMFELGYANEDVIANQLKDSLPEGYHILKEEEIPISWNTSNGTLVTGRPDLVICKKSDLILSEADMDYINSFSEMDPHRPQVGDTISNGVSIPVLGIELKSVHSVWVAREVLFNKHPKLANLAQAAHYMWKLDIPEYKLFYKSYSQLGQGMAGSDWIAKMFPRPGESMSEYVEYTELTEAAEAKGKGQTVKHIKQFEIVYDLQWDRNGRLEYRTEDGSINWVSTVITKQSLHDYFEFVSKMEADKNLGPVPKSIDAVGDILNYAVCKYCALKDVCKTSTKKGYDIWLSEVIKIADQNKNTKEIVKKSR